MNTDNNTFDPTPRLKSSPVPVFFIPFMNNENKCNYCGVEYSKTIEFEQKYCKNCLFWYVKYTTGNNTYLDVHIITNNSQCTEHEVNRNNFCTMNIQEWCEYCSEISYFRQVVPNTSLFYNFYKSLRCTHNNYGDNCEFCKNMLRSFKYDSDCYQFFSGWVESTLTKKSITIICLPWWDNYNICIVCRQKLKNVHQESKSCCQKCCSRCFIIYSGCRYCLTTNIIFGITEQSQCKKCKRISFINIDLTNLSSGNYFIDKFLSFTIFNDKLQHSIADYTHNNTDSCPLTVYQFIKSYFAQTESIHNAIKWISYPQIKNLSRIAEGGFSTIYKATWVDGTTNMNVAVKKLHDSQNIGKHYLNEVIYLILYVIFYNIFKLIDIFTI
jgi:hypothetical protein